MGATINFYNSFKETIGDGTIDLDTHTFKLMLTTSSYTPSAAHTSTSDVTNEVANAYGYTTGGETLANVAWSQTDGTATFDADNVIWTASGGSITARYAVLYDSNGDDLVAYILLDETPADVTVTTGNTLTVAWNGSGIFTLA